MDSSLDMFVAPVSWLPPFRVSRRVVLEGEVEITLGPQALLPFARMAWVSDEGGFYPVGDLSAVDLARRHDGERLRALFRSINPTDLGRPARTLRWRVEAALAAVEASNAMRSLGGLSGWGASAVRQRCAYLQRLDRGAPPTAADLGAAVRSVPRAFRHLGNGLPTAEAIEALRPLGTVHEVGAGMGVFARSLRQAGIPVVASDFDTGGGIGLAFAVAGGVDARDAAREAAHAGQSSVVLILWPQPDCGDWFADVVAAAVPGQVVAIASPELDFCRSGGDRVVAPEDSQEWRMAGPGWRAAPELIRRLDRDFEAVGVAPLVAAEWPVYATPLRIWRRRAASREALFGR